ncbi:MAG: hypothetical protein P4L51_20910 [Puia sp.]|nr:hypothetical protein [Puia sp.]
MKGFFYFLAGILFLSGCAAPLVRVIDEKEVPRPFKNVMVVYVDGNIDFHFLDSTTYNICVRPAFSDTGKFVARNDAENLLSEYLSSSHTKIIKSGDLFTYDYNSYADFTNQIDSLRIEAVLLVDFTRYSHTAYNTGTRLSTSPYYFNHRDKFKAPTTAKSMFQCYLVDPKTRFSVWTAQLDARGKGKDLTEGSGNTRLTLRSSTVKDISKGLVDGGYIYAY